MTTLKKIGLMTSGGDSPGMNAAIRAVVRTGIFHGLEVYGIKRGFQGLIEGDINLLQSEDVANIIQRGGTILKSARSEAFRTAEGRAKAYEQMQQHGLQALVLIGGDGTFTGANIFCKEYPVAAVGLPGTIDKDLIGSDYTIGFDTATNTAIEAIDKIRDTADAHDRLFIVEVMGRDAGNIALHSGIACGAEDILIPEITTDINELLQNIRRDKKRKKLVRIIVVAEGDDFGGAEDLKNLLKTKFPSLDVRTTVLGHIQRGGSPSCNDRILASRLGHSSIKALLEGKSNVMLGVVNGKIHYTPFEKAIKQNQKIGNDFIEMIRELAG